MRRRDALEDVERRGCTRREREDLALRLLDGAAPAPTAAAAEAEPEPALAPAPDADADAPVGVAETAEENEKPVSPAEVGAELDGVALAETEVVTDSSLPSPSVYSLLLSSCAAVAGRRLVSSPLSLPLPPLCLRLLERGVALTPDRGVAEPVLFGDPPSGGTGVMDDSLLMRE